MSMAFVFPGQGSQIPQIGIPWRTSPSWRIVDEVATTTGIDVGSLLCDASAEDLVDTAIAQLTTCAISLVVFDALTGAGVNPSHLGGHSLGEYTAVVAGGVLSLADGARLVQVRGEAMRSATLERQGAMAAIVGLDLDVVRECCEQVEGDVWVANDNGPGQVVVAGSPDAISALTEPVKAAGGRTPMLLKVAGAFHTPFMASAQEALDAAISECSFNAATIDTWSNVDAAKHISAAAWPTLLSTQLLSPVRWREQITTMAEAGVDHFVEVGPGKVLSGLIKRIAPDATRSSVATPDDLAALIG